MSTTMRPEASKGTSFPGAALAETRANSTLLACPSRSKSPHNLGPAACDTSRRGLQPNVGKGTNQRPFRSTHLHLHSAGLGGLPCGSVFAQLRLGGSLRHLFVGLARLHNRWVAAAPGRPRSPQSQPRNPLPSPASAASVATRAESSPHRMRLAAPAAASPLAGRVHSRCGHLACSP